MNRFLFGLALLAMAAAGQAFSADSPKQSGAEKLGWKLTLQSWTTNKLTVFESIETTQKLGVKYLEVYPDQPISPKDKAKFSSMNDDQIKTVLDKAKSCGVTIIDCGVIGIPNKEEDARKLFAWAKKVGITTLVSEPDPKALPMIDKLAGEYEIKVAIHDHPKPTRYWNPEYAHGLIRDLKNIGLCADVGHWKRSGLDPVAVLNKYGEKVFSSHFKDLAPGGGSNNMHDVVWGTGESKAGDMLKAFKAKGFKGPVAIEFESKWDLPMLQKCVDFFNAEADRLAAE